MMNCAWYLGTHGLRRARRRRRCDGAWDGPRIQRARGSHRRRLRLRGRQGLTELQRLLDQLRLPVRGLLLSREVSWVTQRMLRRLLRIITAHRIVRLISREH